MCASPPVVSATVESLQLLLLCLDLICCDVTPSASSIATPVLTTTENVQFSTATSVCGKPVRLP